jgi:hypothetical protein
VAKRRFAQKPEDKPLADLTPEERRAARKAERQREGRSKKPHLPRSGWRRAIAPLALVAVIAVVVVVLYFQFIAVPCLQLQPIPTQSGTPALPATNTTDFSQTWCPSAAHVLNVYPKLTITINGQNVGLPPSIGRSTNFTNYECDLPIVTHPSSSGLPTGTIAIESPWPYIYTLGEFFSVWQDTYVSAFVNSTYSARTIDYTPSQLLGLPADATHSITLFVDGQKSSDGPSLNLDQLSGSPSPTPSCLGKLYGTGHTIALVYQTGAAAAIVHGISAPTLSSALAPPLSPTFDAPMPKVVTLGDAVMEGAHLPAAQLSFLLMRPIP